jgi:hypothetical protein
LVAVAVVGLFLAGVLILEKELIRSFGSKSSTQTYRRPLILEGLDLSHWAR